MFQIIKTAKALKCFDSEYNYCLPSLVSSKFSLQPLFSKMSHTRSVLSQDTEARIAELGEKARDGTGASCPARIYNECETEWHWKSMPSLLWTSLYRLGLFSQWRNSCDWAVSQAQNTEFTICYVQSAILSDCSKSSETIHLSSMWCYIALWS